jgi:hypothetical protein
MPSQCFIIYINFLDVLTTCTSYANTNQMIYSLRFRANAMPNKGFRSKKYCLKANSRSYFVEKYIKNRIMQ